MVITSTESPNALRPLICLMPYFQLARNPEGSPGPCAYVQTSHWDGGNEDRRQGAGKTYVKKDGCKARGGGILANRYEQSK